MTQITLNVADESLLPMLRRLIRAIDGADIAPRPRRISGIEQVLKDKTEGRVTTWDSPQQMFDTLMAQ
jgi:hypothetical protein